MAYGDSDPLQVVPTKIAPELPPPPRGGEAQAAKAVGDELEATKVNNFTEGEATVHQALSVVGDDKRG
jgi:hypothetical protein